jgi:hyperosmotically inducible protein
MPRYHSLYSTCLAAGLLSAAWVSTGTSAAASLQDKPAAADNSKQNKKAGPTADNQKNAKDDRTLAQNVRKAIMDDKTLSTYAHNVKVVAAGGTVTLRGPVRSADEKSAIEAKASEVAGAGNVKNEITIAPKKKGKAAKADAK